MAKGKILIVDDDPDFVAYIRTILESHDYDVVSAGNSDQGMLMLAREKPDLVVLDVIMSSILDGLNMSQQMADDPTFAEYADHHGHVHRQHGLSGALPHGREHPHLDLPDQTDRAGGSVAQCAEAVARFCLSPYPPDAGNYSDGVIE